MAMPTLKFTEERTKQRRIEEDFFHSFTPPVFPDFLSRLCVNVLELDAPVYQTLKKKVTEERTGQRRSK